MAATCNKCGIGLGMPRFKCASNTCSKIVCKDCAGWAETSLVRRILVGVAGAFDSMFHCPFCGGPVESLKVFK
jgi:hypothetical protein